MGGGVGGIVITLAVTLIFLAVFCLYKKFVRQTINIAEPQLDKQVYSNC